MTTRIASPVISTLTLLAWAALVLLPGCDEKPQIQTYNAPKDPPAPAAAAPPAHPTTAPAIGWTLPDGWTADPNPQPPRLASFAIDPDGRVTITRFPGDVGGELANINRWRSQIGLPPITDPAEQDRQTFSKNGCPATLYVVRKPSAAPTDPAIAVAAIRDHDATWFVKLTGPAAVIDQQAPAFAGFIATLELPLEGPPPASESPPPPASPADHPASETTENTDA